MNIAKTRLARILTLIPAVGLLAVMGATAGAAEKVQKSNHANARQSQLESTPRGLAGTEKGTQVSTGKVRVPGRIEYPNVVFRNTGGAKRGGSESLIDRDLNQPDMARTKNEVAIETLSRFTAKESVDRNRRSGNQFQLEPTSIEAPNLRKSSYFLPEVEDEVLAVSEHKAPARNQSHRRR
jgi:hypothetical protein